VSGTNQSPAALSPELVAFLQRPRLVLVTTIDAETGWPTNNLITWTYAKDAGTLLLAADGKGRIMRNIRANERVLLTFMAEEACHAVEGTAQVVLEDVPGVSLKLAVAR
jgi:predicted pyridoxine 5'-phosphate oxidase superfamily flavin-nucleotide-binding protein